MPLHSSIIECPQPEQIIIHVPFVENVRIDSLHLKLGELHSYSTLYDFDVSNPLCQATGEFCPTHLRVYANRPNIVDFSEAESLTPNLDITLRQGETGIVDYPLRAAAGKFSNVYSLSLFFVSCPLPFSIEGHKLNDLAKERFCRRRLKPDLLYRLQGAQ